MHSILAHMDTSINLEAISVNSRRRDEYGDVEALAKSIGKHGLIHPIVIDTDNNLVAGGRRLAAVRLLGHEQVEVRRLGDLSDAQLRELELEENLRRKDLTAHERSKEMLRYVEAAKEAASEEPEFRTDSVQKSKRGRPSKPGSERDVQERTGIRASTVRDAEKHVAAVEKYPELEEAPQSTAIKTARAWDEAPEPEREQQRQQVKATGELPSLPNPRMTPDEKTYYRIIREWRELRRRDQGEAAAQAKSTKDVEDAIKEADKIIGWFEGYKAALRDRGRELEPGNLRRVQ